MDATWWQDFFSDADSLVLSRFPSAEETEAQVAALERLIPLRRGDRIGDICCGPGRHLLRLLARGYEVVGLDFSPLMLGLARQAGARMGLRPALVRGLAQRLPFPDNLFDVVLNLFNSFGYLPTDEENQQILKEAARCLKPGGRFFLDTRNASYQILFAPYREIISVGDRAYVMRCRYDRESRRLESRWFDAEEPSRLVHFASIRLYSMAELETMLQQAGFRVLATFGSYEGEPFEGWQRELLLLCERC